MSNTIMPSGYLRIETEYRKKAGPRLTYVYKCGDPDCDTEVRVRTDSRESHSYLCSSHSHRKRPFESIYKGLFNDHRKTEVSLTYEEFVEFTKIKDCEYCGSEIPWSPYSRTGGEFVSRAYFLDQKVPGKGYSKENCVVCCFPCNRMKLDVLTHEEMKVAMEAVLKYRSENSKP